jgi:hypothetical protein
MERKPRRAGGSIDDLGAYDPVERSALASDGIEGALDEIGAAIVNRPPRAARGRSSGTRYGVLVIAGTLLAIGAGVATGAVVLRAHTGLFPTEAEQKASGPGEFLNRAAPDLREVALELASDVPYPKGYDSWREWVLETQVLDSEAPSESESPFPAGLVSTGAIRGWFAASAHCAWVHSWREASVAGDANAAALAVRTIVQAPGWKAVTDLDQHPDPTAANDPGAQGGTLFGWMLLYRDAVLSGDRVRVEELLATGYGDGRCWLSDPVWMAEVRAHGDEWGSLSQKKLALRYKQFLANGRR